MTAIIHSITDRIPLQVEANHSSTDDHEDAWQAFALAAEPTVAVFSSFLVSPGDAATWIRTWQTIARTAETWPGCRSFRPVRDRNDDMYVAVFSEWDDMDAYRSFVHETGDRWLQGAMGHNIMPGESRFLEVIS
jgi:heme-degrading monooxygenase HmoA